MLIKLLSIFFTSGTWSMCISNMYLNIIHILFANLAFILYILLIDMIKLKMNPKCIFIQSLFPTIIKNKFSLYLLLNNLLQNLFQTLHTIRNQINYLIKTLLSQLRSIDSRIAEDTNKNLFIIKIAIKIKILFFIFVRNLFFL